MQHHRLDSMELTRVRTAEATDGKLRFFSAEFELEAVRRTEA
jgi:hypothetical protein